MFDLLYSCRRHAIECKIKAALAKVCEDKTVRDEWHRIFYDRNSICLNQMEIRMQSLHYHCSIFQTFPTLKIPSYTDMPDPLFKPDFISFVFAQALKLQNSNICSAYSLSNLRPFEVTVDQGAELVSFSSILPLLQLKSLRSVTCPLAVADEEPTAYAMEPITGVAHLSFPKSGVHSLSLAKFLRPFRCLDHFSYIHLTELDEPNLFDSPVIRDGIAHLDDPMQE
jgi:hypothetical protein